MQTISKYPLLKSLIPRGNKEQNDSFRKDEFNFN